MYEGGSVDEVSLCLKRLCGGGLGGGSFTGDPRRYVWKVCGCGHIAQLGPLCCVGNGHGGSCMPGTDG
jgi:hypothetical protein